MAPAQALQLLPHHHQGPVGQAEAEARQGAGQALQGGNRLLRLGQGLGQEEPQLEVLAGQQREQLLHQLHIDAPQLHASPLLLLPRRTVRVDTYFSRDIWGNY